MADEAEQEQIVSGPRFKTPTDEEWGEVNFINSYAMTMAYLSMGVRGLAFLVITWTTVVLLGGFVSVLEKDFWGLTMIILTQTAGIFDVFLREKLSKIWYVYRGLFNRNVLSYKPGKDKIEDPLGLLGDWFVHVMISLLKTGVQVLVLSIVMCPLVAVYMFGLFISTSVSLWRLIEQDYGDTGGSTNLKPALQILYSLALVQGVLFSYRVYFGLSEKHLVKRVSKDYGFGDDEAKLISDYTNKTKIGCEKDPTFAEGRNLITYAVDLIKSEVPGKVISRVRILARVLVQHRTGDEELCYKDERLGQHVLIKQLVGLTSSSLILHKLVQLLHPRCPYDLTVRENAALIVAHLAGDIHLEQLPRGIQCITSLLNEYCVMEPFQRDWLLEKFDGFGSDEALTNYRRVYEKEPYRLSPNSYADLVVQGLQILWKLADDENLRVMSNTKGLVSKITASLSSDQFHRYHHDEWSRIAGQTGRLLALFIILPGEAGQKLRREISTNTQAISSIESILKCDKCSGQLQRLAIVTLAKFFFHNSASIPSELIRCFIQILVDIFADDKKEIPTREEAGEKLADLSSGNDSKATITLILEAKGAIKNLTGVLLSDTKDNKTLRTRAADVLKNLSSHYNKNDEYFLKLKRGVTDIIPEVLREIIRYGSTGDGKQTPAEPDNKEFSQPGADIGVVSQDNAKNAISSQKKRGQQEDRKFHDALLSLCAMVHIKFTSEDPDLAHQVNEIATAICLEQKDAVKTFFAYIVVEAQKLLNAKKAQELEMVPAVAQSSSRET